MFTNRKGVPFIAPGTNPVTINANCPVPRAKDAMPSDGHKRRRLNIIHPSANRRPAIYPAPAHSTKEIVPRNRATLKTRCAAVFSVVVAGLLCEVARFVGPDKRVYRLPPFGYTTLAKHKTSYVTLADTQPR